MCLYPNCRADDGKETQGWNVGTLCSAHYASIARKYGIPGNAALVDDFVKVHVLLQYNTQTCLTHVAALNAEMSRAKGLRSDDDPRFGKDYDNYLKLSRALEFYEGYCWFPANRALLSGLLSTPAFNESQKFGFNKDPGAGRAHGDQSHRLQWHAIMRAMTNGFQTAIYTDKKWTHSPLELFYQYTQGEGRAGDAWGTAMDKQINPGWGNPDAVMVDVLGSRLSMVKEALIRRIHKMGGPDTEKPEKGIARLSERDALLMRSTVKLIKNGTLVPPPNVDFSKYPDQVALKIYTWEKTGPPDFTVPLDPLENAAKMVLEDAKREAPLYFVEEEGTYQAIHANLSVKTDAPHTRVEIDRTLVDKSRGGFCRQYLYTPHAGATPTTEAGW